MYRQRNVQQISLRSHIIHIWSQSGARESLLGGSGSQGSVSCVYIFTYYSRSHKPSDNRLCGLQLLQRHGDSNLGFGVRGQLVQGHGH